MNRQIMPSMILSVLIVCFFSIVLYERDSRGARRDHRAVTPPGWLRLRAAPKGSDTSKVVDEVPQREIKGLAKRRPRHRALPISMSRVLLPRAWRRPSRLALPRHLLFRR